MGGNSSRTVQMMPEYGALPPCYQTVPIETWRAQSGQQSLPSCTDRGFSDVTTLVLVTGIRNVAQLVENYEEMLVISRNVYGSEAHAMGREILATGLVLFSLAVPSAGSEACTVSTIHLSNVSSHTCLAIVAPAGLENSKSLEPDPLLVSLGGGVVVRGTGEMWQNGARVASTIHPTPLFGECNVISITFDYVRRLCGVSVCASDEEKCATVFEVPPQGRLALIVPPRQEEDTLHNMRPPVVCPRRYHAVGVRANANAALRCLKDEIICPQAADWGRVQALLRHPALHVNMYLVDGNVVAPLLWFAVQSCQLNVVRGLLQSEELFVNAAGYSDGFNMTSLYLCMSMLWSHNRIDDLLEIARLLVQDSRCDVTLGLWPGKVLHGAYPILLAQTDPVDVISPAERCPTYCADLLELLTMRLENF